MDLPRPNFQAAQADPLSVLKPSPSGQGQPQSDIEAFSRHLADARRDNNAQGQTPPERQTDHRTALSERRRDEAIDDRRETEQAEQVSEDPEQAEQVSEDKEANAGPSDDTDTSTEGTNADTPIITTGAEQIGMPQTPAEPAPSGDEAPKPGEPDLPQAAQTGEPSLGQDETPPDETAETNPEAAPQEDQASIDTGPKGQEIAQLANIVAQDRTTGAHATANPHRAIQSPLQSTAGEPGSQPGEISAPKDIAAQAAANTPASPGEDDGDGPPLPDRNQGKSLGQEAAAKFAQRKQDHDTPTERPSAAKSTSAAPAIIARPTSVTQWFSAFGLRATGDMAALSLNGDQSGNIPGNLPPIAQNTVQNSNPLLARFGALPGQAQATQVPVTSIAVHMARNLQNGINRFQIRIDPPELGRIDVQMELGKDGKVTAHMTVDRPETLDLLQRDARLLERALQNAGLDTNEDDLDFSLRDDGTHEQQAELAAQSNETFGKPADQTENPEDDQPPHATTLTLTADGRVDIRV